jgi:putative peptide zinc metalloprotease protein
MERLVSDAAAPSGEANQPLPPLREDLRLHESTPDRDGAPAWAIQDPVTNRFYRIGWLEFECLLRWPGTPAEIAADIERNTPMAVDAAQVEDFARFLEQHQLLRPSAEGMQRLLAQASQPGWRHWRWWLHHYLFIRVPLVRPERLLARLLPWVQPLFSPAALWALLLASGLGLILVARQWDEFTHGVMDILTPAGIGGFLLALAISKTLHELGHALVATRLGVRVAHMGVAFVVLWPMLYTDTSESWRLRSHRQRLAISAAGVAVELALAGLATLLWALLEDGPLRQAMLYLATTGWALSLALNASPFMRFDGYFILSDLLDFPNLHERAGALARAWLRRTLLGLAEPDPEALPERTRRALVAFALVTWVYRLVVFLSIALAVYVFFFKILGIFLLGVEVVWFILRPIWSEVSVWRRRWDEVRANRRRLWRNLGLAALGLLLMPWAFDVRAPGVAHPERLQVVYGPFPARLAAVHGPGPVAAGTVLARFEAPDLQVREGRSSAAIHALEQRLAGLPAEEGGLAQQQVTTERLREQLAEAQAVREEVERLQVGAEFEGVWQDVDPALQPGVWVGVREPLGVLADPRRWVVDAYVEQRQVARVLSGAAASFRPEQHLLAINARVLAVDPARSQRLGHAMLDARHGGAVATQSGSRDALPVEALYRVRLLLDEPLPALRETRGSAVIEGTRQSLAWEGVKRVLAVLIRESGF